MHRWFLFVLTCLFTLPVRAQVRFDTVSTQRVGPGMTYYQIEAPTVPWTLDVLELDLSNPYLELQEVEAFDLKAGGRERVSAMVARAETPQRRVVGAINGDFFAGSGNTNGTAVSNGEVVRRANQPAVGVTATMQPFMLNAAPSGAVLTATESYAITGFNEPRDTDALVLYNRFMGSATGTNSFGTEVRVRPLDPWRANDTLRVVAEVIENGVGNHLLSASHVVLSGHGAAATFLKTVQAGDTLQLVQRIASAPDYVTQLISGNRYLVRDGKASGLSQGSFDTDRHPRTAIGFSADSSRLYFVTVDGRQATSEGMSLFELQDFMVRAGIANGINLDGGGSTTMVVNGAIVNNPSDSGVERPVGNGFLAFSTAPRGSLALIQAVPTTSTLFLGQTLQLRVRGTDAYYAPLPVDESRLHFAVDPTLGTVSETGLFTAGRLAGSGYVHVAYDGVRDSVLVTVKGVGRLAVTPAAATTNTRRPVQLSAQVYDTDSMPQSVPGSWVRWWVADPSVGSVDSTGRFAGHHVGTTHVMAQVLGGITDTSTVTVAIGTGETVLDPLDNLEGWHLVTDASHDQAATTLTVADDAEASGGRSIRLHYRFTAASTALSPVYLRTNLPPIFGVPDSVNLVVRSDGARHHVLLNFEDATGTAFTVGVPRYANDSTAYAFMPGPLTRANYPADRIVYPVRLTGLQVALGYTGGRVVGNTYEGDLYFDHLRVTYPDQETVATDLPERPTGFAFTGLRPNPTHGAATVTFTSPGGVARLVAFDVLGRRVATVFDETVAAGEHTFTFDTTAWPSGVYFLRDARGLARPLQLVVLR